MPGSGRKKSGLFSFRTQVGGLGWSCLYRRNFKNVPRATSDLRPHPCIAADPRTPTRQIRLLYFREKKAVGPNSEFPFLVLYLLDTIWLAHGC